MGRRLRGIARRLAAALLGAALAVPPAAAQDPRDGYRQPDARQGLDFRLGDSVFRRLWVQAPGSTRSSDGLGPLYNARACAGCHLRNGRGPRPEGEMPPASLLFRLSVPPPGAGDPIPDPIYGLQIQPLSVAGLRGEGRVLARWQEVPVTLAEGGTVMLRRPDFRFAEPAHGAPHPALQLSPRQAPPLIGMGALDGVPEAAILAFADPEDRDGDGIRGRPSRVWSRSEGRLVLGRFGWKASGAGLADQVAAAFAQDLGLSTPLRPEPWGDCTPRQAGCRAAPAGVAPGEAAEVAPALFELLLGYLRGLAVPPRRAAGGAAVLAGERLFTGLGCAACHRPALPDAAGRPLAAFTDLLLHDMGPDLADGRPDEEAGGRDWRTPPLWGLGLAAAVAGRPVGFLHDGRARSPLEAVLWHGGEAQPARDRVLGLPAADRAALVAFLDSL